MVFIIYFTLNVAVQIVLYSDKEIVLLQAKAVPGEFKLQSFKVKLNVNVSISEILRWPVWSQAGAALQRPLHFIKQLNDWFPKHRFTILMVYAKKKGYRNTQNYDIENLDGFYKRIIGATITTI